MLQLAHPVTDVTVTEPNRLDATPLRAGETDRVFGMASALADAVDRKGLYDPSHCQGVAAIACVIALTLGITGHVLFRIRIAGLLHDVGKLKIPDSILLKPTRLTDTEYDVVKRHPLDAHALLVGLGLHDEARWVLHHHERGDGAGYPTGLSGDAIPLASRILLVADAYDVMTSTRTYRAAMAPARALSELQANTDHQFDDTIVDALEQALRTGPRFRRT